MEERTPSGSKFYYDQGEFIPIISSDSYASYYYICDHLGSIREMSDISGNIVASYQYDPYGKIIAKTGSVDANFQFAGMHYLPEVGLNLTWYRAYNADAGRWLSRDPIGEEGGVNLYGYVRGRVIGYKDPLGLCAKGDFNLVKLKAEVTPDGQSPDQKDLIDKAIDLENQAFPEAGEAAERTQKAWTGITQMYTSGGYPFNIWLELEYECCNCKGTWMDQESVKQEVAPGDQQGSPGPNYTVNFPLVGQFIHDDVEYTKTVMINSAKKKCASQ